jgi:hypothetical protein
VEGPSAQRVIPGHRPVRIRASKRPSKRHILCKKSSPARERLDLDTIGTMATRFSLQMLVLLPLNLCPLFLSLLSLYFGRFVVLELFSCAVVYSTAGVLYWWGRRRRVRQQSRSRWILELLLYGAALGIMFSLLFHLPSLLRSLMTEDARFPWSACRLVTLLSALVGAACGSVVGLFVPNEPAARARTDVATARPQVP